MNDWFSVKGPGRDLFDPGPKELPFPQDPTACLGLFTIKSTVPRLAAVLGVFGAFAPYVNVPPMSLPLQNVCLEWGSGPA